MGKISKILKKYGLNNNIKTRKLPVYCFEEPDLVMAEQEILKIIEKVINFLPLKIKHEGEDWFEYKGKIIDTIQDRLRNNLEKLKEV